MEHLLRVLNIGLHLVVNNGLIIEFGTFKVTTSGVINTINLILSFQSFYNIYTDYFGAYTSSFEANCSIQTKTLTTFGFVSGYYSTANGTFMYVAIGI